MSVINNFTPLLQYYLFFLQAGKTPYFDYFWRDADNTIWRDSDGNEWTTE